MCYKIDVSKNIEKRMINLNDIMSRGHVKVKVACKSNPILTVEKEKEDFQGRGWYDYRCHLKST